MTTGAMTSRQRLLASLQGKPVDRPPVSFYEIGGFSVRADDPDPFNIYNDPSWRPLLQMAEQQTDLIRMRAPQVTFCDPELRRTFFQQEQELTGQTRWMRTSLTMGNRRLTQVRRRDAAINTVWTIEHLLKSDQDVEAFLQLPDEALATTADCTDIINEDRSLGERGIVMIDVPDPLDAALNIMSLQDYTVLAFTNPPLFHTLLEKLARPLHAMLRGVAAACPGHLWRICGSEIATEPYLPPHLFQEYVGRYTTPVIAAIHDSGGWARIHCHGRLRNVLRHIVAMGADAIDPIEPPPQGDVHLIDVRRQYGDKLTLFGNLEASDIENLEPALFEQRVARALREGTTGPGRGFVLLPSACPYGRTITPRTLANYRTMVRLTTGVRL